MIKCPDCGFLEPPGSFFCSECGASLLNAREKEEEDVHPPFSDDPTDDPAQPSLVGQELNPAVDADQITFVITSSGRRVTLDLSGDLQLGRANPEAETQPDLDLTPDHGTRLGVSRTHAVVRHSGEGIVIVDQDSTNGTLLNNYRLPPDLPYPLHDGDELMLGRLLIHVFLE